MVSQFVLRVPIRSIFLHAGSSAASNVVVVAMWEVAYVLNAMLGRVATRYRLHQGIVASTSPGARRRMSDELTGGVTERTSGLSLLQDSVPLESARMPRMLRRMVVQSLPTSMRRWWLRLQVDQARKIHGDIRKALFGLRFL